MSDRQIRILPSFSGYEAGVVCFETQCSREEVEDLSKYAFEHHGEEFSPLSPGSLRLFHERVLLGQDMPSILVLTRWYRLDQLLAAAIFIQPDIVLEPTCTTLVNSFDLLDRFGPVGLAHIPYEHRELAYMIRNITAPHVDSQEPVEKYLDVVRQCTTLLISYIMEGALPPIECPRPEYQVVADHRPVVAFEADDYVWDEFYRRGYLGGIWFRPDDTTVISRKSDLVSILHPEWVIKRLANEDPEGDWSITNGVVTGSSGLAQPELIQAVLSVSSD